MAITEGLHILSAAKVRAEKPRPHLLRCRHGDGAAGDPLGWTVKVFITSLQMMLVVFVSTFVHLGGDLDEAQGDLGRLQDGS